MDNVSCTLIVLAAVLVITEGQSGGLPYTPLSSTHGGASALGQGSTSFMAGGFGQHGGMQPMVQPLTTSTGLGSTSLTLGMGHSLNSGMGTMSGMMGAGGIGNARGNGLSFHGTFTSAMSSGSGAMSQGHGHGIPQSGMASHNRVFGHGNMQNTQTGLQGRQQMGQMNTLGTQQMPATEGYVGAVGGQNGFPFMGGAGPNYEFSDGGQSQGLGNGVGSGSAQAFMERRRTGREDPRPLSGPFGPIYSDDMPRMGGMGGMGGQMGGMGGQMGGMGGQMGGIGRQMGGMGGMRPINGMGGSMSRMGGLSPMGGIGGPMSGIGGMRQMGGMGGMIPMVGMGQMGVLRPMNGMGQMGGMGSMNGMGRMGGMPGYNTFGSSGAMSGGVTMGMNGHGGIHGMGRPSPMMG